MGADMTAKRDKENLRGKKDTAGTADSADRRPPPRPGVSFPYLQAGCLAALVIAVFWPSFKIPFLLDDYQIYLDHWPSVSWDAFAYDVLHHFQQNRFLTHASWYLQLVLESPAPPSPGWFHAFNLVLHWINAILIFVFVRSLGASRPVGFLTSALFAVHPGNMEAVSYIYGRSDLQVTTFLLAALILLKNCPKNLILTIACVAGAVCTKETAVILPALYLAPAVVLRNKSYPFHKMAMILALAAAVASVAGFIFLKTDHADNFGYGISNVAQYLMLQPFCLFLGLARVLVPHGFYIVYHFDLPPSVWDPRVIGSILFWIAFTIFSLRQYRRQQPVHLFAIVWYFSAMAPTNSVIPRFDQISDRHLYLALIGPFWAVSATLETLWTRHGTWIKAIACLFFAFCCGYTIQRNVEWQNPVEMWSKTVARFPNSYLARRELAAEYGRAGDPLKELEGLETVTRRWPEDWTSWNNLGVAYAARSARDKEQAAYQQAIARAPRRHLAMLYHNLGFSFQNDHQIDSAVAAYRRAIDLDAGFIGSKHNLAILLWQRGETTEAERYLREILAINPHHQLARRNLEVLLKNKR